MAASTDGTDAPSTPPPSSHHQPIQDAESPIHDQGRSTGMPAGEGSTLPPLSESQAHASSDAQHDDKILQILAACQNKDCAALKALATSGGGLVDDRTRRAACTLRAHILTCALTFTQGPVLLGCGAHAEDQPAWQDLKRHRDEEQVALDVHRSFIYYPNGKSLDLHSTAAMSLTGIKRNPTLESHHASSNCRISSPRFCEDTTTSATSRATMISSRLCCSSWGPALLCPSLSDCLCYAYGTSCFRP